MREIYFRDVRLLTALGFLIFAEGADASAVPAAEAEQPATTSPASLGTTPEQAIKKFRTAHGLRVEVFAAEPLLANPVSFAFDEKGRAYVVETHRRRSSVYDIRNHPGWLDADFSFRTVEDRLNFFKRVLDPENRSLPQSILRDLNRDGKFDYHDLEVESERIRLVEDLNGDGRADRSSTFADGFNTAVSGVAAGVLSRGGNVWFACVPDLWLVRDLNGDGQAEFRKSLLHGFGVHISFGGHDLHGLCFGPDGKLYFSIGDRGLNVRADGRTIACPDSGAVLRCNADGSALEIVATGLRNPQELAFDQFGNLWTGDDNGDGGDKARWVHVAEGSDSGWHLGWQHLPKLGAWNSERLWELPPRNTAAYLLPPVAHIGHGPAGLAFYPGTGLPERYDDHFFLCDFPGGVRAFALQPKGASYQVVDLHEFLWELYPVDVEFGPEGGAYVADWIEGWEKTGKGRIYRVFDPAWLKDPLIKESRVKETKRLLAEGMMARSNRELARLLEHRDKRVRQEAQFALAERGAAATNHLFRVAIRNDNLLARLHALWGLGQIGRTHGAALACALPLLEDADAEVRAQAARILGDGRLAEAFEPLTKRVQDPSPRVRFFAAMGLGKLGRPEAFEPILFVLRENADQDPYLRHAGVMGLTWLNDMNALIAAATDSSRSVRLAVLLAMRRLGRPEVAMFLYDSDPALILEAARAVYDVPIFSAFAQLASLSAKPAMSAPVLRRALNAHFRLGNLENALSLADYAAQADAPEAMRIEALELLSQWPMPPVRDRVVGLWRPLAPRDARAPSLPLRSALPKILRTAPESVRVAGIDAAVRLEMASVAPVLFELLKATQLSPSLRGAALNALGALKDSQLAEAVTLALADSNEALRKEASRWLALLKPGDALGRIANTLEKGSILEKQAALHTLASLENPISEQVLSQWLDLLQGGKVPKELQLDLLEAAAKRPTAEIKAKLENYEKSRPGSDPLKAHREALHGGDAQAGKKIFYERVDVACLRCHKINGDGGEVGPNLTGIGAKKTREALLESVLYPNQEITAGYETVVVKMKDGATYAGQVKNETTKELLLISPEDGFLVLGKAQIESRQRALSGMPEEIGQLLSKRELRDLVEFLAGLK